MTSDKPRIMVVEDETIVALDIQNRLKKLGYIVPAIASTGESAIKLATDHRPDLVLMDIRLKGSMDGVEAAERIKGLYNIPVVYLTAYSDEHTLQRAKVTEPFGYILKPFEERELRTSIEMALYKHKMEVKLRESEQWLSTTLRSMGDAVIATDKDNNIKFMNPVAETLTGWKHDAALGRPLEDVFSIIVEETGDRQVSPVKKAMSEGIVVANADHAMLVAKDGGMTPIDDSAAPMRDDKGDVTGAVLIFRDITERRRAEEQLQAKNRELEIINSIISAINNSDSCAHMLEHSLKDALDLLEMDAGAVYLSDDRGSRSMTLVTGKYRDNVSISCRQSIDVLVPDDPMVYFAEDGYAGRDRIFEGASAVVTMPLFIKDKAIGLMAFYSAGGKKVSREKSLVLLGIGSQLGIAVENHRLFKQLQDTGKYLGDIINESPDAMLTTDTEGVVLSFNKSASRLLKYAPEEVIGDHIATLLPPGSELSMGESKSYVREFLAKDGTMITLNISASRLYKDDAKVDYIITLKDLSEISGLRVVPIVENAEDSERVYHFEAGHIYLYDKRPGDGYMDVFADQVKHNIQGLCITRQSPDAIRQRYGLEKTPVIWLNSTDNGSGENCIKPDNLTGLAATMYKFLADAQDGLILLEGVEYLMMRNSYESLLKFIHFLNDRVMQSNCRVLLCVDPLSFDERQYHLLLSEMRPFEEQPVEKTRPMRTRFPPRRR